MIFPVCLTDKDDEMVNEDASTCVTTGWGLRKATCESTGYLTGFEVKIQMEWDL